MSLAPLSPVEYGALLEVGKGFAHEKIPLEDAVRLMDLGLIYSLLGSHQITAAGKSRLAAGL
jgi:hypothetical protein